MVSASGTESIPYVKEFLGVADCRHVRTVSTSSGGYQQENYELEWVGSIPDACPECGARMHRHGMRETKAAHTPMFGHRTLLVIRFPRMRCPACGHIWQPAIEGLDPVHKMTQSAYEDIAQRSLRTTFREVAKDYPLSHVTVKNVFVGFMREYNEQLRFKVPAFLGIDEKNLKRAGMVTVITDLEHRTVFDMIRGRTQEDLDGYFSKLPDLDKVRWVCSDMYRPFWKSIAKHTPNATWVIDHFHVVKGANEALDFARKSLQSTLDKKGRLELKKGLSYALRKRSRDLTPYEASSLRSLREDATYSDLMTAYDLKEDFFDIYDENPSSKEDAQEAFRRWEESIPEGALFDQFRSLARTVENHYEYIFNWWDCPTRISNGYTECANRLIKETDMRGRGYDFEVLRARTLYRKQNLDRIIQSNGLTIGPRIDSPEPFFVTEPSPEPGGGNEVIDPETGVRVDATTGEVL